METENIGVFDSGAFEARENKTPSPAHEIFRGIRAINIKYRIVLTWNITSWLEYSAAYPRHVSGDIKRPHAFGEDYFKRIIRLDFS